MKKYFLTKLNFLLGAASLGLIGCHTAKNAAHNDVTSERMYGPPMTIEPEQPEQKPRPIPLPEDPAPTPNPDEPTPVMYGVPLPD